MKKLLILFSLLFLASVHAATTITSSPSEGIISPDAVIFHISSDINITNISYTIYDPAIVDQAAPSVPGNRSDENFTVDPGSWQEYTEHSVNISVGFADNTTFNESFLYTVDGTVPNITGQSVNDTLVTDTSSITIRANVTDFSSVYVSAGVDGDEVSMDNSSGTFLATTTPSALGCSLDGTCTITVLANDSVGNADTSTMDITVDSSSPVFTAINPSNDTASENDTVEFEVQVSDPHLWYVSITGKETSNMTNVSGSYWANVTVPLDRTIIITAYDVLENAAMNTTILEQAAEQNTSNQTNQTSTYFINITSPVNGSQINNSYFTIAVETNYTSCSYNYGDRQETLSLSNGIGSETEHNVTDGSYDLTVSCSAGNQTENQTLSITLEDTTSPVITEKGPSGVISGTATYTTFFYVRTDEWTSCRWDTVNKSYANMSNAMVRNNPMYHQQSRSYTADANELYYVACQDSKGYNTTASINYLVDVETSSSGGSSNDDDDDTSSSSSVPSWIPPPEPKSPFSNQKEFKRIQKGDNVTFYPGRTAIPIESISFRADEYIPSAVLSANVLDKRPSGTNDLANSYAFLSLESNVNTTHSIIFKVNASWARNHTTNISLYRYTNAWMKLPTQLVRKNNDTHFYNATTEDFSYFVIAAEPEPLPQEMPEPEEQAVIREEEVHVESPPEKGVPLPLILVLAAAALILVFGAVLSYVLSMEDIEEPKKKKKPDLKSRPIKKKQQPVEELLDLSELKSFIKEAHKNNYSKRKIRRMLDKAGWPKEIYEKHL